VIDVRPADLIKDEMASLRKESTAFAKNEEDVLIYAMFPDIGQTYLEQRELGTLEPEVLQAQMPKYSKQCLTLYL
jgi:pyruvate carboxylase subunit B